MYDAFDYAKYYIKCGLDTNRNTFDGNMKLQKLLVFADLISLAELNKPLFKDDILAFAQGCVVEKVRLRYKNNCEDFVSDSEQFSPDFPEDEYSVLDLCASIFGGLSARELSEINHSFDFWRNAYQKSFQSSGYRDKSKAVVSIDSMLAEISKVKEMISAYRETKTENKYKEIINGVYFYYDNNSLLSDDVLDELFEFSLTADEPAYTLCMDNERLVIF